MPMSTITVAGLHPQLNILGSEQQFNYTPPLSAFKLTNSFIPTIAIPSLLNMEYRNNMFSGFRWKHTTTSTDTHGSLTLQSFLSDQATGIDIIIFLENGGVNIAAPLSSNLNLNNNKIINLATPTLATDAVTKAYADLLVGSPSLRASLYMENNAVTNSIVTPDAFQKINGITTSRFLTNFTMPSNNRLLYTGTLPITALVNVDVTMSGTGANRIYSIGVYKNGVALISATTRQLVSAGDVVSLSNTVPVAFITNDYIEIFIAATNTSTITVQNLNVSISI